MDQENDPNPHEQERGNANENEQETQGPREQERDCSHEINQGLQSLKDLSRQLRGTREPTCLSFVSSLDTMITLIEETQSQLTGITNYITRMREFYSTDLTKEGVTDLNISKQELFSEFHNPKDNTVPSITKRMICMDWCI